MSNMKFTIDGKECKAKTGQTIVDAARNNGIYIPVLCYHPSIVAAGSCRICTVKVNGRNMAACTTPVTDGMTVDFMTTELEDMRKAIVEMLFVEGNHMCPTCEKSGNCELQAMGYRYNMLAPRFPYIWPVRMPDASSPRIYLDTNRCIQCLRCVNGILTKDGKHIFGLVNRGDRTIIRMDAEKAAKMTEAQAKQAMDNCPVGCILKKGVGFKVPIGQRKFDTKPIGSEIEKH